MLILKKKLKIAACYSSKDELKDAYVETEECFKVSITEVGLGKGKETDSK
ncbi:hypothetical protein LINPERPRIM_LOCUS20932, partial [Linum perenne]